MYHGDWKNPNPRQRKRAGNLREQVAYPKMWPTPNARDWKDTGNMGVLASQKEKGHQESLCGMVALGESPETIGGLNPVWVEWLMGFPIGWTDLNV
jgi:hypothetical protein